MEQLHKEYGWEVDARLSKEDREKYLLSLDYDSTKKLFMDYEAGRVPISSEQVPQGDTLPSFRSMFFPIPHYPEVLWEHERGPISFLKRNDIAVPPFVFSASMSVYHFKGDHGVTKSDLWERNHYYSFGWRETSSKIIAKYDDGELNMDLRIFVYGYLYLDIPPARSSGPTYTIEGYIRTIGEHRGAGIQTVHRGHFIP